MQQMSNKYFFWGAHFAFCCTSMSYVKNATDGSQRPGIGCQFLKIVASGNLATMTVDLVIMALSWKWYSCSQLTHCFVRLEAILSSLLSECWGKTMCFIFKLEIVFNAFINVQIKELLQKTTKSYLNHQQLLSRVRIVNRGTMFLYPKFFY